MAGTLTISTLSDGTNSTSSTNCIQGSAKAWVNFNGSTASIRASFNVSSVTRNSTGLYVINFSTAMSDANYSATYGADNLGGIHINYGPTVTQTTTGLSTRYITIGGALIDGQWLSVAVFR